MPEQKETFLYPQVRQLFDYESWTYSYLVFDPQSLDAVSIDPVLEQHPRDLKMIRELGLKMIYVLGKKFFFIKDPYSLRFGRPIRFPAAKKH